jgi:hypothetical protein
MTKKNIPFDFVFDYLIPVEVTVKPMFGLFALYAGEKIILILRHSKKYPEINGVWIATNMEHHKSLKKDFPSLQSISNYSNGTNETEWQLLPVDADDFENSVIKACEFIKHNDPRIGRIPRTKTKKNKSTDNNTSH